MCLGSELFATTGVRVMFLESTTKRSLSIGLRSAIVFTGPPVRTADVTYLFDLPVLEGREQQCIDLMLRVKR